MRYELSLWWGFLLSLIPGRLGCAIRNIGIPYRHGTGVRVWELCVIEHPSRLVIGNNVSINRRAIIHAGGGVTIGDDTLIGPGVTIYSRNHRYRRKHQLIRQQGFDVTAVTIGRDVWIASNATILPGSQIGDGAVIAAGAVVKGLVQSNAIVAGVPAVRIGERQ